MARTEKRPSHVGRALNERFVREAQAGYLRTLLAHEKSLALSM